MKKTVEIKIYQQDWIPGFAAYLGDSLKKDGHAKVVLNLGSIMATVAAGDVKKKEVPYFVAESLMHEVFHVLEEWAGVQFSEKKVHALIQKYAELYSKQKAARKTTASNNRKLAPVQAQSRKCRKTGTSAC